MECLTFQVLKGSYKFNMKAYTRVWKYLLSKLKYLDQPINHDGQMVTCLNMESKITPLTFTFTFTYYFFCYLETSTDVSVIGF